MRADVKRYPGWIGLLVALLLNGCAGGILNSRELHRLEGVDSLPRESRIGMTEFTVCGGGYLETLAHESLKQDQKAIFFHKCTELDNPRIFTTRLRHRLEQRLGRKLEMVETDKSYKPQQVMHDAEKRGVQYVIAGDLLYLGEKDNKTVVTALFYLISVSDKKIVVVGRVKKDGPMGKVLKVIDDVADELFAKAYE
jgi:TolB-like protein